MKRALIFLILVCALISCKKGADKEVAKEEYGNLEGAILDESGQPVAGAMIIIKNVSIYSKFEETSVYSGSDGKYSFSNLPINNSLVINTYSLAVSRKLYVSKTQNVKITENSTTKFDLVLSRVPPFITLSDTLINAVSKPATFRINVTSDQTWTIKNSTPWLTYLQKNGQGDGYVDFAYLENPDLTDRRDTVEFGSVTVKKRLIVNQYAPVVITSSRGVIGKGGESAWDTVFVQFNKPIATASVQSATLGMSLDVVLLTYLDSNKQIRFLTNYIVPGKTYTFALSANDGKGNSLQKNFNITP